MNDHFLIKTRGELTPAEIRKIAVIDNTIPQERDPYFVNDDEALKNRIEFFEKLSDQDFFMVLHKEGSVIAFHVVRKVTKECALISTLWVEPSHRKTGIGSFLKEEGQKWAKESRFKYIQTGVNISNDSMLSLNRKIGYQDFTVIMRLKL